jgi:hypothetical protein
VLPHHGGDAFSDLEFRRFRSSLIDNWLTIGRQLMDNWSTIDQQLINNWSTIDQQLVNNWSTIGWQLINNWSTIDRQLIDFGRLLFTLFDLFSCSTYLTTSFLM